MRKPSRIIQGISKVAGALVGRRETSDAEVTPDQPASKPKPERRRDSRSEIQIPGRKNEYVRVTLPPATTELQVCNLSMRGLCLFIYDPAALPAAGEEFDAIIQFGDERVPTRLYLAYRDAELAGCHVVDPSSDWLKEVSRVLDPIRLGKRLREIDPNFVRQDGGALKVRWFQSGPACDLYVWSHESGDISKAQLFFDWQIVEWTEDRGIRAGRATTPPSRQSGHPPSEIFEFTDPPDPEILGSAQRLLNAAKKVPVEIRSLFL